MSYSRPIQTEDWPPRFTFTPEGVAGLWLRKHFPDATGEHQQELADLFRAYARGDLREKE
jgi:hypothetical protein